MSQTQDKILLGVNVDHCATVRQARYRAHVLDHGEEVEPDPVAFALLCEQAGADGITMHLREDRRHVQDSDVERARACIGTRLNLEMACTLEMIDYALRLKPDSVCLVPESREEITTEGGLDIVGQSQRVGEVVAAMSEAGIATSLFIDPHPAQIEMAAALKSPWIELHTGTYANAYYQEGRARNPRRISSRRRASPLPSGSLSTPGTASITPTSGNPSHSPSSRTQHWPFHHSPCPHQLESKTPFVK
jgi:pyridoxine 5-phosphate synthase